jgi:hypothetical protein
VSHGDVLQGRDWPRRLGLVVLALTSLIVVAGIVTGARSGRLVGSPGWGAIVLPFLVLTHILLLVRRSGPSWIIGLIGAPAALVSAFYWLLAVAG